MNRATFLASSTAATLSAPRAARGAFAAGLRDTMTQDELFASLPSGKAGEWTRMILGSGATYQKQIGLGSETSPTQPARLYVETQVGRPGGPLDPASLRKAYLRDAEFGSLVRPYAVATNVGRTGNTSYRYGESTTASRTGSTAADGTILYLLDLPWLYDTRPLRVLSAQPERIHVAGAVHEAIHLVARSEEPRSSHERLERVDVWYGPAFPFGVARYRATLRGLEPFELNVSAHGDAFSTALPLPLDEIRSLTKNA